jgi:hypothetical protein
MKPSEDPIVREKHRVQEEMLKEAGGDIRKYSEIVRREAKKLRDKHPGHFKTVPNKPSIAA